MPINLPNLDDRAYEDLVEEARALIPTYAPQWTNHNPSDPGVTLVELFAYLTEVLLYRLNRVTDANVYAFLRLLNAPDWQPEPGKSLNEHIRETMLALREPYRAVTCEDFVYLSFKASGEFQTAVASSTQQVAGALGALMLPTRDLAQSFDLMGDTARVEVRRALCVPERNLENDDPDTRYQPATGHISVVLVTSVPDEAAGGPKEGPRVERDAALLRYVRGYLDQRRLVTTRVHVVKPLYFPLRIRMTLVLNPDALTLSEEQVRASAESALRNFLDPLTGGPEGTGWPFGRNVYVSEIYELLDRLPEVDYVTRTRLSKNADPLDELTVAPAQSARVRRNARGEVVAVELLADELVAPQIDLTIRYPTADFNKWNE